MSTRSLLVSSFFYYQSSQWSRFFRSLLIHENYVFSFFYLIYYLDIASLLRHKSWVFSFIFRRIWLITFNLSSSLSLKLWGFMTINTCCCWCALNYTHRAIFSVFWHLYLVFQCSHSKCSEASRLSRSVTALSIGSSSLVADDTRYGVCTLKHSRYVYINISLNLYYESRITSQRKEFLYL